MNQQSITVTFLIDASTREEAVTRFLQFMDDGVTQLVTPMYGILGCTVEIMPGEEER